MLLSDGTDLLSDWTDVSLASLHGADTLRFSLASSDSSVFSGAEFINTPTFFALDNIVTAAIAVPEPGGALLILCGALVLAATRPFRGGSRR